MERFYMKERTTHGNADFPIGVYSIYPRTPYDILDCHWHDEIELLYVIKGHVRFQIEAESYEAEAGDALFVNSGALHAIYGLEEHLEDASVLIRAVVIHPSFFSSHNFDRIQTAYLIPLLQKSVRVPVRVQKDTALGNAILPILLQLLRLCDDCSPAYEIMVKGLLFQIFYYLFQFSENSAPHSKPIHEKRTEQIKSVLQYIQAHSSNNLTVNALAEYVHMSEGHFCRIFKEVVQKTPIEYIHYYRILQAAEALVHTDVSILDISLDVGFNHYSYFIKVFKKYMGCSPKIYRKQR